jgi:hypothetical protein
MTSHVTDGFIPAKRRLRELSQPAETMRTCYIGASHPLEFLCLVVAGDGGFTL